MQLIEIGPLVKRCARAEVKHRKACFNTAYDFFKCAQKKFQNVQILFMSAEEINKHNNILEDRWKTVQPISKIQQKHHFHRVDNRQILSKRTAESANVRY